MAWLFPDVGIYHRLAKMESFRVPEAPTELVRLNSRLHRRYSALCGRVMSDIGWYRSDLRPERQPFCTDCYAAEEAALADHEQRASDRRQLLDEMTKTSQEVEGGYR